jgi:hypothetical protein
VRISAFKFKLTHIQKHQSPEKGRFIAYSRTIGVDLKNYDLHTVIKG